MQQRRQQRTGEKAREAKVTRLTVRLLDSLTEDVDALLQKARRRVSEKKRRKEGGRPGRRAHLDVLPVGEPRVALLARPAVDRQGARRPLGRKARDELVRVRAVVVNTGALLGEKRRAKSQEGSGGRRKRGGKGRTILTVIGISPSERDMPVRILPSLLGLPMSALPAPELNTARAREAEDLAGQRLASNTAERTRGLQRTEVDGAADVAVDKVDVRALLGDDLCGRCHLDGLAALDASGRRGQRAGLTATGSRVGDAPLSRKSGHRTSSPTCGASSDSAGGRAGRKPSVSRGWGQVQLVEAGRTHSDLAPETSDDASAISPQVISAPSEAARRRKGRLPAGGGVSEEELSRTRVKRTHRWSSTAPEGERAGIDLRERTVAGRKEERDAEGRRTRYGLPVQLSRRFSVALSGTSSASRSASRLLSAMTSASVRPLARSSSDSWTCALGAPPIVAM